MTQDESGSATKHFSMADVSSKPVTLRRALAYGRIMLGESAYEALANETLPKGDPRPMAEFAGISGAKMTSQLIPLCHPISLNRAAIQTRLEPKNQALGIYSMAEINAKTGVEMEALTGLSMALLTVWDLCKPVNPALGLTAIRLLYKSGGKTGEWVHPEGLDETARAILRAA